MHQAVRTRIRLITDVRLLGSRKIQIRRLNGWTRAKKQPVPAPLLLAVGAIGISTFWPHQNATICEAETSTINVQQHKTTSHFDDDMIDAYVNSLMKDHEMVRLPFHLGKTKPFVLDVFEFHKTLVKEAIGSLEWTIDTWNLPQTQGQLAGHPIVYTRTRTLANEHLTHNPAMAVAWDVLEQVADALLEEPRILEGQAIPMRLLPYSFKRLLVINTLHVMTSILIDLMLSSSVSVHNGAFEMQWTFHPKKAEAYYQSLNDKTTIQTLIQEALEQIDFDVVQDLAADNMEPQNSFLFSLLAQDMYATGYRVMLIVFYIFNWDTECRMMGRCVRQKFVKPTKKDMLVSSNNS